MSGFFHNSLESFSHTCILFCRGLEVADVHSFSEGEDLIRGNHSFEVALAPHEVDRGFYVVLVDLVEPVSKIVERCLVGKVETQKDGVATSVVGGRHRSVSLLACCVPQLGPDV